MNVIRVIPCLDVDRGRVVKGTNFVDLRDAGDPVELGALYDAAGGRRVRLPRHHGELHDDRDTTVAMAAAVAEQVFIPFTIGGGIRSVDDARRLLRAGADKVSVNSAAVNRPELVARDRRPSSARSAAWSPSTPAASAAPSVDPLGVRGLREGWS
jgi:imidazole glycerol-phosphate synthase subunit HisF